jgi:hypothetical protein
MSVGVRTSLQSVCRIAAWGAWQLFLLCFVFIVYANLFSEYGAYSHPAVDPVAAVLFFVAALYIGTWIPVRRWQAGRHPSDDDSRYP